MRAHPVADMFPMMSEHELRELAADIKANGMHEPIVLDPSEWKKKYPEPLHGKLKRRAWRQAFEKAIDDGAILIVDGRNRYTAGKMADLPWMSSCDGGTYEITYREFGDSIIGPLEYRDDITGFIISKNIHRRHLTESQRAMVAAKIATTKQGARTDLVETSTKSQAQAAEMLNVSRESVVAAKKVLDRGAPELVAAVVAGDAAVSAAARVAETSVDEQRAAVAKGKEGIRAAAKEARDAKRQSKSAARVKSEKEKKKAGEAYVEIDGKPGDPAYAAFMLRADAAVQLAELGMPVVNEESIALARRAADAWAKLAGGAQ